MLFASIIVHTYTCLVQTAESSVQQHHHPHTHTHTHTHKIRKRMRLHTCAFEALLDPARSLLGLSSLHDLPIDQNTAEAGLFLLVCLSICLSVYLSIPIPTLAPPLPPPHARPLSLNIVWEKKKSPTATKGETGAAWDACSRTAEFSSMERACVMVTTWMADRYVLARLCARPEISFSGVRILCRLCKRRLMRQYAEVFRVCTHAGRLNTHVENRGVHVRVRCLFGIIKITQHAS